MISHIRQMILEHPEWLRRPGVPLSFLKASTPTSGTSMDRGKGKVLLFVFEEGQTSPTLGIKTTRTYSAGDVIKRNYNNLKLLAEGVRGSEHAQMFATPLYLYDDGNIIFSVETICPGVKFFPKARSIELVMEKYIAWQSHLARETKKFQTLGQDIQLPVLIQYGDMTPDNVLVSGENIYLIDYDCVGETQLPGFDLFIFLSKIKLHPEVLHSYYERYFPRYFRNIGAHVESYNVLFPFYYGEEVNRKTKKT